MLRVFSFSFFLRFSFFYAHAKSTTHANSGSPCERPPSPSATHPIPGNWQLSQFWNCLGCLVHALGKLCCAPATCLYYDIDLLGSLISGKLQQAPLALSLSLCPSLCLSLSLSRSVCAPSGVIEIILLQLYQRGNPNDKYINKLQARCDSPQLGTAFSFGAHFSTRHFSFGIVLAVREKSQCE